MLTRWSPTPSPFRRFCVAALLLASGGVAGNDVITPRTPLSPVQARWLDEHPAIVLASDPAWPPFSRADQNGRVEGIDADFLQLIEARLRYRFKRAQVATWSEALAQARNGQIDVLSGTARLPEREDKFVFTRSYVSHSIGIVTRTDDTSVTTLANLAGRRVATMRDHAVTALLRRDVPDVRLTLTETVEQALRLVSNGDADAVVANLVNASYLIKQRGLANLRIAGIAPYRFELRFAVRRDWPELAGILDAAIASLDETDKQRILERWVQIDYGRMVTWEHLVRLLVGSVLAVAAGMGAFLWHNRRLRRELHERHRVEHELRAAHGQLTQLNEEKTRIINMAAHDLRNPLTGVLLSVQLLETAPFGDRHRLVADTTMLCRRMLRLISNLLDAQILEEGRRPLQFEAIDLAAIGRESVHDNRVNAERKRIVVRLENVSAPQLVRGDRGALRQVVDNLLSNAIKFSPIGGHVWLSLQPTEGAVRLAVRDDGPGIASEDLPRLFTKYGRLGHRPTGGESSIGLGLTIVRQLMDAMQGRVWCESQLGRGATFVLELAVPEATRPPRDLSATESGAKFSPRPTHVISAE